MPFCSYLKIKVGEEQTGREKVNEEHLIIYESCKWLGGEERACEEICCEYLSKRTVVVTLFCFIFQMSRKRNHVANNFLRGKWKLIPKI